MKHTNAIPRRTGLKTLALSAAALATARGEEKDKAAEIARRRDTPVLTTARAFRRASLAAALLLMPCLAWVSFAAFLNFTLWRFNP
jgi:hypothetical protein